jgi:AcrR family transcriptional regulator
MDSKPADLQPVLQAALRLVDTDGLKGLSLRPLAEQLGTTAPALIRRYGSKDELLTLLVEAAVAEEGVFLDGWLARIRALDVRDGERMVEIAEAMMSDLAGPEAARARFYCELLLAAATRPEIAESVAAWSARRLAFWTDATQGLDLAEAGEILHAYSVGEAGYGLALGDMAAYRWLRRLNLRRLCCGLIPADGARDLREFAIFSAALGELLEGQPESAPMTEWQAGAVGYISEVIIAEGADAVTHRAIAARAGLANSTLAYHFPRQEDLLRAGLDDVVARVRSASGTIASEAPPEFYLTSIQSARATFALSLVTQRMPSLKAVAADLRRRRGENYVGYLERQLGEPVFDALSSQAMSLTGLGQHTLDAVLAPTPAVSSGLFIRDRLRDASLAARNASKTQI